MKYANLYIITFLCSSTTSQSNEICNSSTVVQRRIPTQMCSNSTPASSISAPIQWRHSDSHYGFRAASINYGNTAISHHHFHPHIHQPHHLLPHSTGSNQIHPMSTMGVSNTDTNYASVNGPDGYRLRCSEARDSTSNIISNSNYFSTVCSTNLPSYLWGPPPPYSQPNDLENVNADDCDSNELMATQQHTITANDTSTNNTAATGVSPSITSNEMIVSSDGSPARNNLDQQPTLMRTTKSGILLSPNENHRGASLNAFSSIKDTPIISCRASGNNGLTNTNNNELGKAIDSYDDSVHSAMHIYEQAKNKSIDHKSEEKRLISDSNCNSLPLRRMKKQLDLVLCRSEANLTKVASNEEENLVKEVRQKLNELGLYKYQRSKAARELAEIRQALCNLQTPSSFAGLGKTENVFERSIEYPKLSINMQSFPLPPIPVTTTTNNRKEQQIQLYHSPSIVSSACSTTENKYETIGKSINPYKITSDVDKKDQDVLSNTNSASDSSYGFIASSVSPMSIQTNKSSLTNSGIQEETGSNDASRRHSPSSSGYSARTSSQNSEEEEQGNSNNKPYKLHTCLKKKESSHYAQISPLRGHGVPSLSSVGSSSNDNVNKPSYFRVRL